MDDTNVEWLMVNRNTLLEANMPAMQIVDLLISQGQVYDPRHDDYQRIDAESTVEGKTRILLDTLLAKSSAAFHLFKKVLGKLCPHILAKCVDPPDALKELDSAARSYYKENLKVRPLTWLKGTEPVKAKEFFLNLSIVEKTIAIRMMSGLASNSTGTPQRQEYVYSRPDEQTLVYLDNLFPQFQTEETCQEDEMTQGESSEDMVSLETFTDVTVAGASRASSVAFSGRGGDQFWVFQSAQRVGIYGGAGCGKTSCLMKAASMYAEEGLWQGARAFLLWRLRDPNVQDANSLKQLLRELKLGFSDEKCKKFEDVLIASEGERIILAFDGIDELDTTKQGFIWRLLDGSSLPKASVLATSRPSCIAKTYFDGYGVNLELLGFTEEQVDQFIEQQLGDKQDLLAKLHLVLFENPTLASLMLVPLLAMMVCQVFRLTAKNPPTSRTMLYSKLLSLVVRRTVEKDEGRLAFSAAETYQALAVSNVLRLKGTAKKLVSDLAKVAFQAHKQGKSIFDHNFVEDEASCSHEALHLGLLCGYSTEDGLDIVQQYSFQHLTMQEFLVAYCLVAHATSEQAVTDMASELVSSRHNYVVLQFFAGLLAESLRPHFFAFLDKWLHDRYNQASEECRSRLRVCLQCAKEACGENVKGFPSTLQLPHWVDLEHVTAADLTQLSLAVEKSHQIKYLYLMFDVAEVESETKKVSRVQTQTRRAMTRLMAAVSTNKYLRRLVLYGPKYSLFEEEGWRLLVKTVENNSLVRLVVVRCALDNASFHSFSDALKRNTTLKGLWLRDNGLNDASICTLADDLKQNNTLQLLDLRWNSYGESSCEHLRRQLKHITKSV